jgi:hypothetical protein
MADTIDVHSTRDTRDDDLINGMLKWRRYDTFDETPVVDEETARDTRDGAWHDATPAMSRLSVAAILLFDLYLLMNIPYAML